MRRRDGLACGALALLLLPSIGGCGPEEKQEEAQEVKPFFRDLGEEPTAELIESLLPAPEGPDITSDLYLNLMKLSLTDLLYENDQMGRRSRVRGSDWPSRAYTMIGLTRLNNLQQCVEDVLANDVPGDLIETGAWRGGATIFMRAMLKVHGDSDRNVWVADSFEGLPPPDTENYPADAESDLHEISYLAVSQEEVERNFRRYGLLDDQVKFLKGWFKDSLPDAPIEKLAVLRLDADLYESTTQGLEYLYPKLSSGGYVIIDDYGAISGCREAVEDYRAKHGITEPILKIDGSGVYWKKR